MSMDDEFALAREIRQILDDGAGGDEACLRTIRQHVEAILPECVRPEDMLGKFVLVVKWHTSADTSGTPHQTNDVFDSLRDAEIAGENFMLWHTATYPELMYNGDVFSRRIVAV
jgi:hypothetical protein